ncbi:MAG: ATP-binding protein [Thermoleophilia bacterium]|nr:ATP-binding protein [Thermoleophilia bacterium]
MRRIRQRLLLSFLAVVVAAILGLALVSGLVLRGTFLDRLELDMARQARELAVVLDAQTGLGSRLALDPPALETLARESARAAEVRFTIIAHDGRVLADSDEDPAAMENHATRPEVVTALSGGEGLSRRYSTTVDTEMLYVAVPLSESNAPWSRGVLRIAVPSSRIDPLLRSVLALPLWVGLVLLAPALGFTYLLSRSMTRPIEYLRSMAVAVSKGDLTYRVGAMRNDELGELGEALNDMAGQLEERMGQLVAEREQIAEILAVMGDGVLVLDDCGTVARANKTAATLLDTTVAALEGRAIVHVAREFPALALAERTFHAGIPIEEYLELPGARTMWVQAVPLRESIGRGRYVLILFRDETARARVDRMRRDFVSNVSHELKTPLAGLSLLATTLQHAVDEDPVEARRFARRLSDEISQLTNLVNDLLTLSRLEETAAAQGPPLEPVDLGRLAREAEEAMAEQAASRGLSLAVSSARTVFVAGHAVELETALRNLLDNALRYTDPGGHVDVDVHVEDGWAVLVVRDDGLGIPRSDQPRIFERFYRVDKARSRETGGTGLGLSIVRHVVERHRGSVNVESTLGVGSTFTVRLPLLSPDRREPGR